MTIKEADIVKRKPTSVSDRCHDARASAIVLVFWQEKARQQLASINTRLLVEEADLPDSPQAIQDTASQGAIWALLDAWP